MYSIIHLVGYVQTFLIASLLAFASINGAMAAEEDSKKYSEVRFALSRHMLDMQSIATCYVNLEETPQTTLDFLRNRLITPGMVAGTDNLLDEAPYSKEELQEIVSTVRMDISRFVATLRYMLAEMESVPVEENEFFAVHYRWSPANISESNHKRKLDVLKAMMAEIDGHAPTSILNDKYPYFLFSSLGIGGSFIQEYFFYTSRYVTDCGKRVPELD